MKYFILLFAILVLTHHAVAQESEAGETLETKISVDALKDLIRNFPLTEQERILSLPENIINSLPFQRSLWFAGKNYSPGGVSASREEVWQMARPYFKQERERNAEHTTQITSWRSLGPFEHGGRTLALAIDPTNTQILYAGSAGGGLWKSTDQGTSWFPLTDNLPTMTVDAIAINNSNPNELYIGTGENSDAGSYPYTGFGLFYSRDGGASWTKAQGLNDSARSAQLNVTGIAVHPTDGNIVFATIGGNSVGAQPKGPLFKSTDKGVTWVKVNGGLPATTSSNGMLINPLDPNVMYLNCSASNQTNVNHGVWKSVDGGTSWTKLGGGLPAGTAIGKMKIALCYTEPNIVCTLIANGGGNTASYYLSLDDGATWAKKTIPGNLVDNGAGGQGWYDLTCAIKADDPNTLYIGGILFSFSLDQGASWTTFPYFGGPIHPDQQSMAVSTTPSDYNLILLGNDGGIYRSFDDPSNWDYIDNNYVTLQYYGIDIGHDNAHKELTYGGTQDNGTWRADSMTGSLWNTTKILEGDGFYAAVDYSNGCTVYAENFNGGNFSKSVDCGNSFSRKQNGLTESQTTAGYWSTPFVTDPINPQTLYWAGRSIYKTVNGANSWSNVKSNAENGSTAHTIGVAASNSKFVMVGFGNGRVQLSTDAGATWARKSSGLLSHTCSRVAFDPLTPAIAYATYEDVGTFNRIFKTIDTGATWVSISGNYPRGIQVHTIVVGKEPSGGTSLYIGTDMGVFQSTDDGVGWFTVNSTMGNQYVHDLKISAADPAAGVSRLRAGTFGRGIWETDIPPQQTVSVGDEAATQTFQLLLEQNYPNPTSGNATIRFELPGTSEVTLTVSDALGRVVKTLVRGSRPAGAYQVLFTPTHDDGISLRSGVYTYRLTANGFNRIGKMVLTR